MIALGRSLPCLVFSRTTASEVQVHCPALARPRPTILQSSLGWKQPAQDRAERKLDGPMLITRIGRQPNHNCRTTECEIRDGGVTAE